MTTRRVFGVTLRRLGVKSASLCADSARTSGEECLADVLARLHAGRYGEDRRAGELEVLHDRVVARHLGLQRDEVRARVADVGDEEQPRVQTAEGVRAVDEVVAPPEH